jgi:hypothetical protein
MRQINLPETQRNKWTFSTYNQEIRFSFLSPLGTPHTRTLGPGPGLRTRARRVQRAPGPWPCQRVGPPTARADTSRHPLFSSVVRHGDAQGQPLSCLPGPRPTCVTCPGPVLSPVTCHVVSSLPVSPGRLGRGHWTTCGWRVTSRASWPWAREPTPPAVQPVSG